MTERPVRVLIVDDDKNMRTTLADILLAAGYDAVTVESGEEAIALCAREAYDVVLLDVRMRGVDGVEVFRRIRRQRQETRVILMSAYGMEEEKRAALEEGAVAFLSKPLDIERVLKLIGQVRYTAILVVEHDAGEAAKIVEALRPLGYRVSVAPTARDALDIVGQIRFDTVLINAVLPVMNGLQLYLAIKRVAPGAAAIMLTGSDEESVRLAREAVDQTAYATLMKPLNVDRLREIVQHLSGQQLAGVLRKPGPAAV